MENHCAMCGEVVPEGREVCWICTSDCMERAEKIKPSERGLRRRKIFWPFKPQNF